MKKITSLKLGQKISFDSENGILEGKIIELYLYQQEDNDGHTFDIVAEVEGHDVNYNLSVENILEKEIA